MPRQWYLHHITDDLARPCNVPHYKIAPNPRTLSMVKSVDKRSRLDVIRKREEMIATKFRYRSIIQQKLVSKFGIRYKGIICKAVDNCISKIRRALTQDEILEMESLLDKQVQRDIAERLKDQEKYDNPKIRAKPNPKVHQVCLVQTAANSETTFPHVEGQLLSNRQVHSRENVPASSGRPQRPHSAVVTRPDKNRTQLQTPMMSTDRSASSRPQSAACSRGNVSCEASGVLQSPIVRPRSAIARSPSGARSCGQISARRPSSATATPQSSRPSCSRSGRDNDKSRQLTDGDMLTSRNDDELYQGDTVHTQVWWEMPYKGRTPQFPEVPKWALNLRSLPPKAQHFKKTG